MATRSAPKEIVGKAAEHLAPRRLKEVKRAAPKAALSVARSLGSGESAAKAAVTALKGAGERVLGEKSKGRHGKKAKMTNIIEEVDIGAPRRLVYDQWTQFQEFPSFTKKVQGTEQVADEKLQWEAKILWSTRTWESTIVEQIPDERMVWRSTGAKGHVDGAVTFHELSPDLTRVLLVLEYHPQGLFEKTANLWRAQGRRVRLELKHFRRHVMTQTILAKDGDVEGWRGEIRDGKVTKTHDDAVSGENGQGGNGRKRRESRSTASSKKSNSTSRTKRSTASSSTKRSTGTKESSGSKRSSRSSSTASSNSEDE